MSTTPTCDRCGAPLRSSTMSKFNVDIICLDCKDDERAAPGYAAADAAEAAATQAGNLNFPGVGLSTADLHFLRERRKARKERA